jgi:hypothetical protein
MKIKTSELTGFALAYAVAIAEGYTYTMRPVSCEIVYAHASGEYHFGYGWNPGEKWVQGGPIIEREHLTIESPGLMGGAWIASRYGSGDRGPYGYGPTPLIAAMRCYVASKLGDEVDVPEELL